jgi:sulfofructosephosphate aldolase
VDDARRAGVESVLEVIVREQDGSSPSPERQAQMLVDAAADTASLHATLYKTEVPFRNLAPADDVTAISDLITRTVSCPWVVLSGGVAGKDFPEAVKRTAAGGAQGFLAGRAVWEKATGLPGDAAIRYLREESVQTLAGLRAALGAGRRASV